MALEGPDEATQERYREFQAGMVAVEMPPASDYPPMLQPEAPGSSLNQMIADSFAVRFFEDLTTMPDCCVETLGKASESLAVLERDLIRKAVETLDEARAAAHRLGDESLCRSGRLLDVAMGYKSLAEAAS